ncbi:MAG: hypothetical protein ACT4OX_15285 [Actinomycetota bacterium]
MRLGVAATYLVWVFLVVLPFLEPSDPAHLVVAAVNFAVTSAACIYLVRSRVETRGEVLVVRYLRRQEVPRSEIAEITCTDKGLAPRVVLTSGEEIILAPLSAAFENFGIRNPYALRACEELREWLRG